MKKYFAVIGVVCIFLLCLFGCSEIKTVTTDMGKTYTEKDGVYLLDNREYKYKIELTGRTPNAVKDATFVVLTNNEEVTFDEVSWSILSSSSNDFLNPDETVIIDIK